MSYLQRFAFTSIALGAMSVTVLYGASTPIRVTITSNVPAGGVSFTPVWVGFHDGSFDSYNSGQTAQPGLERIAEDGDSATISSDFLAGYTYVDGANNSARVLSSQAGTDRVDATLGAGPIGPGGSVSRDFLIDMGANRYLSYVSMVVPSNDYFIANGNPVARDLVSLFGATVGTEISFTIGAPGTINDAGTEVNFANISGPGDTTDASIAGLGLLGPAYIGQSIPNTGSNQNGVVANVVSAFSDGFGHTLRTAYPKLNFNDGLSYTQGIATVSVKVVPEPTGSLLVLLGLAGLLVGRPRRS